jgi:Zn-dependent protease
MMMERNESIYVGNLGPIPLFLHWSFLIFLFLVVRNYGSFDQPELLLVALTVLLSGIILHELGHGLTAKALGAVGISITLGAFGGVCKSTRDSLPRRELLIVAAGPLVSFALAGIGYGLLWWLSNEHPNWLTQGTFSRTPSMLFLFVVLMYKINLLLGIFNSLPIYPLDGGQLVYNGLLMMTRNHAAVRAISLSLAFAGAAIVLSWWTVQTQDFPIYMAVLFAFLLFQAYVHLR